jgi:hypothetical protein
MEVFDAKVLGSRPVCLTNPETGVKRLFTIVLVTIQREITDGSGKAAKTEVQTENIEVWVDRLEKPPRKGAVVGLSQDEEERWNIWF